MRMKLAGYPIVTVEWIDSTSRPGWNQVDRDAELRVVSVGALIYSSKDRIIITKSVALGRPSEAQSFHSQMHIPRCAIRKMRYL